MSKLKLKWLWNLAIAAALLLAGDGPAFGEETTPEQGSQAGVTEVSNGERVVIDGKGFSIVPPTGWTIQKNLPRSSLYLQAKVSGSEYPRNISAIRFREPAFINATTAESFAAKIVREFPAASSTIERYTLRNHQSVQMADGREGILFYTDFDGSGKKMMQAHILVSSETNHYLVTYTDVAENFENPGESNQFFNDAWAAMTSIELDSPNPVPSNGFEMVGLALLFGFFAISSVAVWRKWLAAKVYRRYGDLEPGEEAVDEVPKTQPTGVSEITEMKTAEMSGVDMTLESDMDTSPGFAKKILNFRGKKEEDTRDVELVDAGGDDGMEFTVDVKMASKGAKWKRGA
jgi:hypothetical protein